MQKISILAYLLIFIINMTYNLLMKHPLLPLLTAVGCLNFSPKSYAQDIFWEKSFGGRHSEYLSDVQPTADYGFILAGSSLSENTGNKNTSSNGDLDFWIWKMDEHGDPDWQKSYGGTGTDLLRSIRVTRDGGFILAGISNSPISFDKKEDCRGGNDYWILKLDAGGQEMWQRTLGGKGQDDLTCIVSTSDGGYLVGGSSNSDVSKELNILQDKKENSRGSMDYWIIKLDSKGQEEWQKTYGGDYTDLLKSIAVTTDGGYILGGYSTSGSFGEKSQVNYGTGGDYWLVKIDKKGLIEWQQTLGGDKDDQLALVISTYDGGYLVGGSSISGTSNSKNRTNGKGSDFWILKLDETGVMEWQETYDFGEGDVLTSIVENEDHTYLIGGYSVYGKNGKVSDYIALKISQSGERLWERIIGSDGEDILQKVIETRDGGYLMAGTADPEMRNVKQRSSRKSSALNPFDSEAQLGELSKAQQEMDNQMKAMSSQVNSAVSAEIESAVGAISEQLPSSKDSNFDMGLNLPTGNLLNPQQRGAGSGQGDSFAKAMEAKGPKPGSKFSGEKKLNYGKKDYWIVKLKNKEKKIKERIKIEAAPNPTAAYTNVVIGFDFDSGSATVYDISGRQLQQFSIDTRTVPVNISNYPIGIYIINIKTNKGEGSVKIIKE